MSEWQYGCMGSLTHAEIAEVRRLPKSASMQTVFIVHHTRQGLTGRCQHVVAATAEG